MSFMSNEAIWLIISGICFVAEIFTVSFLLFLPGIAAFISFLLALFNFSTTVQIISFAVTTTLMIIFIRPFIKKIFKSNDTSTNSNALIGKTAVVIKDINSDLVPGQVKVSGEIWTAITESNIVIPKDSLVKVNGIDGVKLLVSKIEEE